MSDQTIPSGWQRLPLGEIIVEKNERVGNEGSPVVLSSTKYHGLVSSDEYFKKRVYSDDISKYKLVRRNWFAYATNHLSEGSIGLQTKYELGAVSPMYTVFETGEDIDPAFLSRVLKTPQMLNKYRNKDRASVDRRGGVRFPDFASIRIIIPPYPEQQRIAKVLDEFDAVIQQSKAGISKLKQLRAGLINDLLTCGINGNGEVRDSIAYPEQFKDSQLDKIPLDWVAAELSDLIAHTEYGISVPLKETTGIPVLRMNNMKNGEFDLADLKFSENGVTAKIKLRPFDILFNRTNSYELVGKTAIWRGQIPEATFASYLVRLTLVPNRINPEFLNLCLNFPFTQLAIKQYATPAVQQVNINPTNLRKVTIRLPKSLDEQELIVKRLAEYDQYVRDQEVNLKKLQQLKQGLLDDLVNGEVRIIADKQIEV